MSTKVTSVSYYDFKNGKKNVIDYVILKLKVNTTGINNTQAVINKIIGINHHALKWPLRKLNISLQKL